MDGKDNRKWFAVYTSSRAEKKVHERFREAGFESFCPTKITIKQWSDRKKKVEEPLFRSYVFVKTVEKDYEKIRRIDGVVNFVYYLGKPAVIRNEEIDNIKNFLGRVSHSDIRFEKDEKVIITEGVMKDIEGIVERESKNTLRVRIEQLGLVLYAEIKKDFVDKIKK